MAEVTYAECDRCEYCGKPLRWPPTCCQQAIQDHSDEMLRIYHHDTDGPGDFDDDEDHRHLADGFGAESFEVFDDDGEED